MTDQGPSEVALALRQLLDELHPRTPPPTIFVFEQQRYTAAAVQMLAQYRRINRRTRDDLLIGLNEFHTALLYLAWSQFDTARDHLVRADFHWSLANLAPYLCLTRFAQGRALQLALHLEEAAQRYHEASMATDYLLDEAVQGQGPRRPAPLSYLQRLKREVAAAQEMLHAQLRDLWAPAGLLAPPPDDRPTTPDVALPGSDAETAPPYIKPGLRSGGVAASWTVEATALERTLPGAAPGKLLYEVSNRTGSFLPQLAIGDRLRVAPLARRDILHRNQLLVVLADQVNAQVQVMPVAQQAGVPSSSAPRNVAPRTVAPRTVAPRPEQLVQLVRETSDGRLAILAHDQRRPLTCERRVVVGVVEEMWRRM
jgi:hypothetical protein